MWTVSVWLADAQVRDDFIKQKYEQRAFSLPATELLPEAEREIPWMIAPADLLHGPLSWLLCGLIIGHIAMALIHRFWLKDKVLARMVGGSGR